MTRSLSWFIVGAVTGFGLGYGVNYSDGSLFSRKVPALSQKASPAVAIQTPRDVTVAVANVESLFDVVNEKPDRVSGVLLTMTGSVVELKNGIRLYVESLERQPELGEAAKHAGIPWAIE